MMCPHYEGQNFIKLLSQRLGLAREETKILVADIFNSCTPWNISVHCNIMLKYSSA
jgi:hypothetical protein